MQNGKSDGRERLRAIDANAVKTSAQSAAGDLIAFKADPDWYAGYALEGLCKVQVEKGRDLLRPVSYLGDPNSGKISSTLRKSLSGCHIKITPGVPPEPDRPAQGRPSAKRAVAFTTAAGWVALAIGRT